MMTTSDASKTSRTRFIFLAILLLSASGCAPAPSDSAICDTLGEAIRDHALALSHPSTPDDAVTTGARLIRGIDAGCT